MIKPLKFQPRFHHDLPILNLKIITMTKLLKILVSAIALLSVATSCSSTKKEGKKHESSTKEDVKKSSDNDDDKPATKKSKKKNLKHKGSEIK